MNTLTATYILITLTVLIFIVGNLLKNYTAKRLDDIDGFRGFCQKKDLGNRDISKYR